MRWAALAVLIVAVSWASGVAQGQEATVAASVPRFPEAQVFVLSSGNLSCGSWTTQKGYRPARVEWVLGYWSGLNVAFGRVAGANTDAVGILDEIVKECEAQPSEHLAEAVNHVYLKLAALGR